MDVDYPELMRKKCEVISQTPQLSSLLGLNEEVSSSGSILYKSPHYIAIGCDLANIDAFGSILENEISIKKWMVLCTAEVSVTYMDAKAADNLITWFAQDQNNDGTSSISLHPSYRSAATNIKSCSSVNLEYQSFEKCKEMRISMANVVTA